MRDISKLKNGSFYFISELRLVEECFVDALAGLSSVIATNVKLTVNARKIPSPLNDLRISKSYGNWVHNPVTNHYELNINQLLGGGTKNYVFEINVPPVKRSLPGILKQ